MTASAKSAIQVITVIVFFIVVIVALDVKECARERGADTWCNDKCIELGYQGGYAEPGSGCHGATCECIEAPIPPR